jgi:hypothetical protein
MRVDVLESIMAVRTARGTAWNACYRNRFEIFDDIQI